MRSQSLPAVPSSFAICSDFGRVGTNTATPPALPQDALHEAIVQELERLLGEDAYTAARAGSNARVSSTSTEPK